MGQKLEEHPFPGKIIVYSSSIAAAEELAGRLGCRLHHRNVDTPAGKQSLLAGWRGTAGLGQGARGDDDDAVQQVIVSTNALGLGLDVPDVRVVIHIGWVPLLKAYAQESGRAGRDRQPSEAVIITSDVPAARRRADARRSSARKRAAGAGAHGTRLRLDIDDYLAGQSCRRVILDEVMDGRLDRSGCELGEERCDVCTTADEHLQPPSTSNNDDDDDDGDGDKGQRVLSLPAHQDITEVQEERRQRLWRTVHDRTRWIGRQLEELVELVEKWVDNCSLCYYRRLASFRGHSFWDCERAEAEEVRAEARLLEHQLREWTTLKAFSGCYICLLPRELCWRWASMTEEQDDDQFADQVRNRGSIKGGSIKGGSNKYRQRRLEKIVADSSATPCELSGVILAVFSSLWAMQRGATAELMEEWMERDGVVLTRVRDRCRWLGKKVEWGTVESNMLCEVTLRLSRDFEARPNERRDSGGGDTIWMGTASRTETGGEEEEEEDDDGDGVGYERDVVRIRQCSNALWTLSERGAAAAA